MRIHPAYSSDTCESVSPGELRSEAASLLKEIPFGHSVVAVPAPEGSQRDEDYAYDPEFRLEGHRYFKVLRLSYDGKIRNYWLWDKDSLTRSV